ncbi:hypothetical protein CI102_14024 [Trichoderma harzianum]|nr:hypothetical protein CI102_14024 [Trichoderma harzianum]
MRLEFFCLNVCLTAMIAIRSALNMSVAVEVLLTCRQNEVTKKGNCQLPYSTKAAAVTCSQPTSELHPTSRPLQLITRLNSKSTFSHD